MTYQKIFVFMNVLISLITINFHYYLSTNGYFCYPVREWVRRFLAVLCSFIAKRFLTGVVYGLAVGADVVGLVL